jgi:hypothetical protein
MHSAIPFVASIAFAIASICFLVIGVRQKSRFDGLALGKTFAQLFCAVANGAAAIAWFIIGVWF